MTIQFNTDRKVNWDKSHEEQFHAIITHKVERHIAKITRIEVHVSDENADKSGPNDIRCLMEARVQGHQPLAVTAIASTHELAITDAAGKLAATLNSTLGRMGDHRLFRDKP